VAVVLAAGVPTAFFACVGTDPLVVSVVGPDASAGPSTSDGAPSSADGGPSDAGPTPGDGDVVDAQGDASDPCYAGDASPGFVFATSYEYKGSLGGLAGADQKCNDAALNGGLSGKFRAWLSTGGKSAKEHVVDPAPSRPYRLVADGGPFVIECAARLVQGSLNHPIDHNQRAEPVGGGSFQVWTGTAANGSASPDRCGDWGSSTDDAGTIGDPQATNGAWTASAPKPCSGTARLYCFEVP
jgi:hypothetical protein